MTQPAAGVKRLNEKNPGMQDSRQLPA
jgi:hypothetical protein